MEKIDLLGGCGYVRFVESWGRGDAGVPEAAIIEAARQSTQGSFRGWERDERLLRYLHEKRHSTPFEFAGLTIEVQAPIFVFREWHRHRVPFGYSEMSARYEPLPDVSYVPSIDRLMMRAGDANKQASRLKGALDLNLVGAHAFRLGLKAMLACDQLFYRGALAMGVTKELARLPLPVTRCSRMRATGNLRGWLGFLTLRMAPDAQYEIRQCANAVGSIIAREFPRTWEIFCEGFEPARKAA